MKTITTILALALILAGCGTPGALDGESADNLNRIASGDADSAAKQTRTMGAAAASYMGSAHTRNVSAESSIQRSNSQSGTLQQGWSFAGVANVNDAIGKRLDSDPVIAAAVAELNALPPDASNAESRKALRDEIAARIAAIESSVAKAGGDLSALRELTQVFINWSVNGNYENLTAADEDMVQGCRAAVWAAGLGGSDD